MRTVRHKLIVEMNGEFENRLRLSDGKELYIDTSYEHYKHVQQHGIVYATSSHIKDIKVGDKVWFHHFVPVDERIEGGYKSNHIEYLKRTTGKLLYLVDATPSLKYNGAEQLFAYENESGVHCYKDSVLITPIKQEIPKTSSGIYLQSYAKEVDREGIISFGNEELSRYGFKVGDRVMFSKHSEYELNVNGTVYWRMRTRDIILKYGT